MNILIVDDVQVRHNIVETILGKEHTIFHAFDVFDAIEIFETSIERIGLCLFGYNFNCFSTGEDGQEIEKTGCDLIEYIALHIPKDKHPCLAIVHSHREDASRMIIELKKLNVFSQHRPFSHNMITKLKQELVRQ